MTVLVVGATGATGRLLTKQLLDRGCSVRAIVRSAERLPDEIRTNNRLDVVEAGLLTMPDDELNTIMAGCEAIASCLGHNLTFKGMYGKPRRFVTDAARRLCKAAMTVNSKSPTKYVLMNTTGNRNRDLDEPISTGQKIVVGLLRVLLPPHADNEEAADYLRTTFGGANQDVEWCAVRPDSLVDESSVSEYTTHPSPTRSAIFDAGQTSRINVAHFIADLITRDEIWNKWKGQMPVLYNKVPTDQQ